MLMWLHENISTIVVALILLAVVAAIVVTMVRDHRAGKHSCGGDCGSCGCCGACHQK